MSQLAAAAGIPEGGALGSRVCHFFASFGLSPAAIPFQARDLVTAGAASAMQRGLLEWSRKAARRVMDRPSSWAPAGGVFLGCVAVPDGMTREAVAELQSMRKQAEGMADKISDLPVEDIRTAAASVATAAASPPEAVGALVLSAAAAAALWWATK